MDDPVMGPVDAAREHELIERADQRETLERSLAFVVERSQTGASRLRLIEG
jgi:hypothetical protein